jgi:hypothetical protein
MHRGAGCMDCGGGGGNRNVSVHCSLFWVLCGGVHRYHYYAKWVVKQGNGSSGFESFDELTPMKSFRF